MSQKTILIVGGAGYIGSHTAKYLNALKYNVLIFDNLSTGHADAVPKMQLIVGDLSDAKALTACFENHAVDVVMHFASSIIVSESVENPAKYYKNNVANTINLLDVMWAHHVNNIIFSSTAAVYGNPIEIPISIDHPKNPSNPYGKSKAMVEQIIEDYHHAYGLKYVCLRYFNAAGADPSGDIGESHPHETHLIPLALQVAQGQKKELLIYGDDYDTKDGTCIRDYVHVCDIAQAHVNAMHYLFNHKTSRCFNLGLNIGYSVKEVIEAVAFITQKKLKVKLTSRRKGDAPILVADASDAKNILNWRPIYTKLNDIIRHAWQFECIKNQ